MRAYPLRPLYNTSTAVEFRLPSAVTAATFTNCVVIEIEASVSNPVLLTEWVYLTFSAVVPS
jgi:hypothetical protein